METVVGQELQLRATARKRSDRYELVAPDGRRVALLSLYGVEELAHIACAEGVWRLRKRLQRGWELVIESADGRQVGWYSGHGWLPGGTISLINGTQVDLRRSLTGGWKLQTTDTRELIVEMHAYGSPSTAITIRSLPKELAEAHVAILTGCAVLILERTLPSVSFAG